MKIVRALEKLAVMRLVGVVPDTSVVGQTSQGQAQATQRSGGGGGLSRCEKRRSRMVKESEYGLGEVGDSDR